MVAWVIEEEFGIQYHPGHVRRLLHRLGFSVQRPRRVLARASAYQQAGSATPIPGLKKTQRQNWASIFTDKASFRQDSTLHTTWSRVGCPPEVPVTGQRKEREDFGGH